MTNYTQAEYQRDVKILADAPEESTHIDIDWDYWSEVCPCDERQGYTIETAGWIDTHGFRSLDDIRALTTMYERLQKAGK